MNEQPLDAGDPAPDEAAAQCPGAAPASPEQTHPDADSTGPPRPPRPPDPPAYPQRPSDPTLAGASSATQLGWYGKLPALGDFVSRRLPEDFTLPWDAWLQRGMSAARAQHGDAWDELYLTFPVWRFVLPPGLLGDTGWTGVLLPSVDRVGRHFPLTLALPLAPSTYAARPLTQLDADLDGLAVLALGALKSEQSDYLDQRVAALDMGLVLAPDTQPVLRTRWLDGIHHCEDDLAVAMADDLAGLLIRAASDSMLMSLYPRALWWLPPAAGQPGVLRILRQPLSAAAFVELLAAAVPSEAA